MRGFCLLHQVYDAIEYPGFGHLVKQTRLFVVDGLGLSLGEFLSRLALGIDAYGVDTLHALGGIGVFGGEVEPIGAHSLLPCHGMIGHGVVEHAIHIEEHAAESLPLVLAGELMAIDHTVQVSVNLSLVHYYNNKGRKLLPPCYCIKPRGVAITSRSADAPG